MRRAPTRDKAPSLSRPSPDRDPDDRAPFSRPTQADDATIDEIVAWLSDGGGVHARGGGGAPPGAVAAAGLNTRGQLAHALLETVRGECEPALRLRAARAQAEATSAAAVSARHAPPASASKTPPQPTPPQPGFEGARGPGGHRARGWGSAAPETRSRLPGIDIDDATEFPSLGISAGAGRGR